MDHVQSFQEGSERAFNYFFREHYTSLTMFACRITNCMEAAEEIAGDALLKLWERRRCFTHPLTIRSFLYKVVRFASLNFIRDRQRESSRLCRLSYVAEQEAQPVLQHLIRNEACQEVMAAVRLLPPQCRRVVESLYVEERTPEQVALNLRLSVSTIRNQKARAMLLLRKRMDLASCEC